MSQKRIEIKNFLLELNNVLQQAPEGLVYIISANVDSKVVPGINAGITAAVGSSTELSLSLMQSFKLSSEFKEVIDHAVNCKRCNAAFNNLN